MFHKFKDFLYKLLYLKIYQQIAKILKSISNNGIKIDCKMQYIEFRQN